jgi:hypothetical protein
MSSQQSNEDDAKYTPYNLLFGQDFPSKNNLAHSDFQSQASSDYTAPGPSQVPEAAALRELTWKEVVTLDCLLPT